MLYRAICVAILVAVSSAHARAGWVVSIGNATVRPGDSITLDVTITGAERLDAFFGEFLLTPVNGAPAGGVRFTVDGFGQPPLPPLSDPEYAFPSGNSFAISNLPSNPASVYSTVSPDDTYLTSDGTLDLAGVDVSGGRLLARLTVAVGGSVPNGARYQVQFGGGSLYLDQNGTELLVTPKGGTITVLSGNGPVPTPEPTSLTLMTLGLAGLAVGRWRRPVQRPLQANPTPRFVSS